MSYSIAALFTASLALGAALAAQGPESRGAKRPASAPGQERIAVAEQGFSIQPAKGWSVADPVSGAFLLLMGEESPGEFRANLNVRTNVALEHAERAALRKELGAEYKKLLTSWAPAGDGDVEIDGRACCWFAGTHEQAGHEVQMLQYFVPGKPKSLVATFACRREEFAALEPALRAMASSIRWKPAEATGPKAGTAVMDAGRRVSIAGHKISLVAPKGWEIGDIPMGVLLIVFGEQVGEFRTNVCVTTNPSATPAKPSEAAAAVAKELKPIVSAYQAAGSGSLLIAAESACWVSSRFTQGKQRLRNIQYFVTGAAENFVVTFTTLDAQFEKLKKTFEEVARSIKAQ